MKFLKGIKTQSILVISIIILSLGFFYRLDQQYMWTDEVFSFHAAERIIETGKTTYESGHEYPRAPIYHKILASSMKFFGENEFGSRIINIPFAAATALLCFFFVSTLTKDSKHRYLYATTAALLYIFSNFTLAQVRETRMYTMETFLLTASIFSFVMAFLNEKNLFKIDLKKFKSLWAITSAIFFILAFNTHVISAIFALCVFIFLLILAALTKKKETIGLTVIITITGIIFTFIRFGTLNLYTIFSEFSPYWGTEANPLYFPVLLVRNFPGVFILSPVILWNIYKTKDSRQAFLLTTFITYILFISLQTAQSERYLVPIIPVLLVLTVLSVSNTLEYLNKASLYYKSIILIVVAGLVGHGYLFAKELNEIDTYTPTSISIHKKFQFNRVEEYLTTLNLENYTVLADEHSAYTLYQKGFKIDYILMPDRESVSKIEGVKGKDIYFNIKYLAFKEGFKNFLTETELPVLAIVRNYENFGGIAEELEDTRGFNRPKVYISKP